MTLAQRNGGTASIIFMCTQQGWELLLCRGCHHWVELQACSSLKQRPGEHTCGDERAYIA